MEKDDPPTLITVISKKRDPIPVTVYCSNTLDLDTDSKCGTLIAKSHQVVRISTADQRVQKKDGFSEPNNIDYAVWVEFGLGWLEDSFNKNQPWKLQEVKGIYKDVICQRCKQRIGRFFPYLINSDDGGLETGYAKLVLKEAGKEPFLELRGGEAELAKLAEKKIAHKPTKVESARFFNGPDKFYMGYGAEQSLKAAMESGRYLKERVQRAHQCVRRLLKTPQYCNSAPEVRAKFVTMMEYNFKKWKSGQAAHLPEFNALWDLVHSEGTGPRWLATELESLNKPGERDGNRAWNLWNSHSDSRDCVVANLMLKICSRDFKDALRLVNLLYGQLPPEVEGRPARCRDDTLGGLKDLINSVEDANLFVEFIQKLNHPENLAVMKGSLHGEEGRDPRKQYGPAAAFFIRVMESAHLELLEGRVNDFRKCVARYIEICQPSEANRSAVRYQYSAWKAVVLDDTLGFHTAVQQAANSEDLFDPENLDVLCNIFHAFAAYVVYFKLEDFSSIRILLKKATPIFKTEPDGTSAKFDFHVDSKVAVQFLALSFVYFELRDMLQTGDIEIVTGKGNHGQLAGSAGILKELVEEFLDQAWPEYVEKNDRNEGSFTVRRAAAHVPFATYKHVLGAALSARAEYLAPNYSMLTQ